MNAAATRGVLVVAVLAGPLSVLFGSCLIGRDWLVFRDLSHYYQPLYAWLVRAGWPLWTPQDQFGLPTAADPTTGWFYPGRLWFALGIPVDLAWCWTIVLHLLIAGTGAARLTMVQGHRGLTSQLTAAAGYALSGPVLFSYCNPPYLIGAAWLPWTLAGLLMLHRAGAKWWRRLPAAAVPWALMLLGGDPQGCLHVALLAVAFAIYTAWSERRWRSLGLARIGRLLACGLLASGLGAGQLIATITWLPHSDRVRQSNRAHGTSAEIDLPPAKSTPLVEAPEPAVSQPMSAASERAAAMDRDRFAFSVGPWQWPGVLLPGWAGRPFVDHQRWTRVFDPQERLWTPTLYGGTVISLIVLWGLRTGRFANSIGWLSVAVFALAAATGKYGLNLWFGGLSGLTLEETADWGGPYGWLMHVVPGYRWFRYPGKWLPIFALAWSQAAAQLMDFEHRQTPTDVEGRRTGMNFLKIIAIALIASSLFWAMTGARILSRLELPPDAVFGPFNAFGTTRSMAWGIAWSAAIAVLLSISVARRLPAMWLVGLIVIDLTGAATLMIGRIPRDVLLSDPRLSRLLRTDPLIGRPPQRVLRCDPTMPWPTAWSQQNAVDRLAAMQIQEAEMLEGRWHLVSDQARVDGLVGLGSGSAARVLTGLRSDASCGEESTANGAADNRSRLSSLAIEHTLRFDRESSQPRQLAVRPAGRWFHWVDDKHPSPTVRATAAPSNDAAEPVLLAWSPEHFALQCESTEGRRLRIAQLQDGWWTARYRESGAAPTNADAWRALTVKASGDVEQEIDLPPGRWRVEFHYAPWHVAVGLIVAWLSLAICVGLATLPSKPMVRGRSADSGLMDAAARQQGSGD